MVFSATIYLELLNLILIYHISRTLPPNVKLVVWAL
jgi:hypothetical protein